MAIPTPIGPPPPVAAPLASSLRAPCIFVVSSARAEDEVRDWDRPFAPLAH
jgi:hypothetical protein